jgi:uncharacterized protein (UPF0179 family)
MVVITLVGELQARQGGTFAYTGPISECRDCKLKTICFNLDAGKWYKIVNVRSIHHDCRLHENGVRVVEAEPVGIPAAIPSKSAIEGTVIAFEPRRCGTVSCENYRLCNPIGVTPGGKYRVTSVLEEVSCEDGQALKKVLMT